MMKVFALLPLLPLVSAFQHPGLLVTKTDITRIKTKVNAQQNPWYGAWSALASTPGASISWQNQATAQVNRDGDANADALWTDAATAFIHALQWQVTGNNSYADAAASILTAWGEKLVSIGDNDDQYLVAGLQGHELANAAELLRDYPPFKENGLATFQKMMTDVFLAKNIFFLEHEAGSEHNVKHFFASWELGNVASAMAIAVLTDNSTTWDFAVNYFKNGTGNGAIGNAVTNIVEEPGTGKPLGQGQEEGRDQGHTALDFQLLGVIGQQGWNQGEDLFGYADNRILLGAEYFARYNLGNDVPFEPYTNGIVSYTEISGSSRGSVRPAWEVLYNHYVVVKGQSAPWTEKYLNYTLGSLGYELGAGGMGSPRVSGNYDSLGWGTLLYRLDESDVAAGVSANSSSSSSTTTSQTQYPSSSVATTATKTSYSVTTAFVTTYGTVLSIPCRAAIA